MMYIKIRRPTHSELETCEMVDATSIIPWNPYQLTDDTDTMEANEYDKLKGIANKRKMNMKMKKQYQFKQDPKEIAPFSFHPKDKVLEASLNATTQCGTIQQHFPMQVHHKSRNPLLQRRRINEIMQQTHGSPLSQALKVLIQAKASIELSQNMCHIMAFKLNHKELIVCLISSGKKEFQSPS